jgi:deazaflavin-dependent oxidoreductase (nitroreductase family)
VRLKDELFKLGTGIHRAILRMTKGRLLGQLGGMPVIILRTTGRKTGKQRFAVLTSPVLADGRIVLVASYAGDDRHPKWFLNLREDPDVGVTIEGHERPMRARVASPEEHAELWPRVIGAYRGYAAYQERSARDVPLVILEPTP